MDKPCACGCGRPVVGKRTKLYHSDACRLADYERRNPLKRIGARRVVDLLTVLPDAELRDVLRQAMVAREIGTAASEGRAPRPGRLRVRWTIGGQR